MSADRLTELRRQRAMVQEQLAWLDREIAAIAAETKPVAGHTTTVEPSTPAARASVPVSQVPTASRPFAPASPAADAGSGLPDDADLLLEKYRVAPAVLKQDLRKGCFLYFALALALLGLLTVGLYFALRPL